MNQRNPQSACIKAGQDVFTQRTASTQKPYNYHVPYPYDQQWPGKARKLQWLQGLRGAASLLVYWHHHQLWAHDQRDSLILELSFGFRKEYHFVTLPGIRTFFTGGHFAVAVLFVLSGFASSISPLTACYEKDYPKLVDQIASSLCRRWFRLYIPFVITTFIYMSTWYLPGTGVHFRPADASPLWLEEVRKWFDEFKRYTFIFDDLSKPWFSYNTHLWSILLEFRGSLLVYTVLLALSRFTRGFRVAGIAVLIVYFLSLVDGWYCALFLLGSLLCDFEMSSHRKFEPTKYSPTPRLRHDWFFWWLLGLAVYLGNVPHVIFENLGRMPGWYYLSLLKPKAVSDPKWFYLFWAASMLVLAIIRLQSLKRCFEASVLQYLGRISFGIYLVHGPVLWTIGDVLYRISKSQDPRHATTTRSLVHTDRWILGLEPWLLMPQALLLPITLLSAHLTTVGIEEPMTRFLHTVFRRATI